LIVTNPIAALCRYSTVALDILLVDDDRDFADLLAGSLRAEGHRVCVSRDATSALARASELEPHVVVLDIGLPGVNGNELAH
jgi:DNA-binding response OmpR family regulator